MWKVQPQPGALGQDRQASGISERPEHLLLAFDAVVRTGTVDTKLSGDERASAARSGRVPTTLVCGLAGLQAARAHVAGQVGEGFDQGIAAAQGGPGAGFLAGASAGRPGEGSC